jgi:hypothetical protein
VDKKKWPAVEQRPSFLRRIVIKIASSRNIGRTLSNRKEIVQIS